MECKLTANGAFKPRSGAWLPTANGWLYYSHHSSFLKYTYNPSWAAPQDSYSVGGGSSGMHSDDEADVLFWWQAAQMYSLSDRCTVCDPNVAWVYLGLRYPASLTDIDIGAGPTIGKLIFSVGMDEDFSDGFFVSLKSVPMQIAVSELSYRDFGNQPLTVPPYKSFVNTRRHGYSTPRKYIFTDDDDAISESTAYITTKWPGTNELSIPVRDLGYWQLDLSAGGTLGWSQFSTIAGNTLGRIYDGFTWYYSYPTPYSPVYTERQWNTGQQVLTFVNYELECGTIENGNRTTVSKRLIWQPIDNGESTQKMWLGVGERFARAGLGGEIFLPEMPIEHPTVSSRWEKARKHWKVEAKEDGSAAVQILDNNYTTSETAGLSAFRADAMHAVGMNVTESPKSMSRRSSLATSHTDLIWKHGAIHGIDEDHTRKALVSPKTTWPMKQPQHSVALSIGGAASAASTLSVVFETETTLPYPWWWNQFAADNESLMAWCRERIEKPIAYAGNVGQIQDETGRIGTVVSGYYTKTPHRQEPNNEPFAGVFDATIEFFDNDGIPNEAGYYWDQSSVWTTYKVDHFMLNCQSLKPTKHPQVCLDGTYTLTNSLPYGGGTSPEGAFSCTLENSGDTVEGWPQLELPYFAFAKYEANGLLNYSDVLREVNGVASINTITYAGKQSGRIIGGGFLGTGVYTLDASYNRQLGSWLFATQNLQPFWTISKYEVTNTPTKLKTTVECGATASFLKYIDPVFDSSWQPPDNDGDEQYPKPEELDDVLSRKCQRYKFRAVKSVKWTPKITQMFASFVRLPNYYYENSEYDYSGGEKADSEKLTMVERYEPGVRSGPINPRGGRVMITLRRSWECECVVASGSPTYNAAEVIEQSTEKEVLRTGPSQYSQFPVGVKYRGHRKIRYSVEWDIDEQETKTHKFAHEQCVNYWFSLSEAQFVALEEGQEVVVTGQVFTPPGGAGTDEDAGNYGIPGYKNDTTTVRLKLS